ncbi:MAG: Gfo/Idh/MocA family oxidoreductase [Acetobacteraceae bacterium]
MIGLAVIGLGNALIPHARAIADLPDRVRVVWAVARDPARLRAIEAEHRWKTTTDIAHAVQDPSVDAVLVLTHPNTHRGITEQAFAAGKHVLCEKPLAVSVAEAEAIVAAGRRADRRLGVVLQMRMRPGVQRLRAALKSGELGEVQAASMVVPWWRPQAYYDQKGRGTRAQDGGGVLMTQAIHTLDLFHWLLPVREVVAALARTTALHRMETEDWAAALLRLENGAPATLTATTAAYPGSGETIDVIGATGSARLSADGLRLSFLDNRTESVPEDGGSGSGANLMGFSHAGHRAVLADFLDAIEQERDPLVTGEAALATQNVIEAILAKAG